MLMFTFEQNFQKFHVIPNCKMSYKDYLCNCSLLLFDLRKFETTWTDIIVCTTSKIQDKA